jgi:hypothetical protein
MLMQKFVVGAAMAAALSGVPTSVRARQNNNNLIPRYQPHRRLIANACITSSNRRKTIPRSVVVSAVIRALLQHRCFGGRRRRCERQCPAADTRQEVSLRI